MRVRYCLTEVDYANEWPVRVGVVLRDGSPTHLVAIYCHVATDGHGLDLLTGDLATMDPASGLSTVSTAATPPLAQAQWQQSPAGLQHSAAAITHFERLLRQHPVQRSPALRTSGDRGTGSWCTARRPCSWPSP